MVSLIGHEEAATIRRLALELYQSVYKMAAEKGIIIADTKFEFGRDSNGQIVLIDEIFTPDSSRFWKMTDYCPGKEPPAYDKQYVRNYLNTCGWDKNSPPPPLPEEVIVKTTEKYAEIFKILTGQTLP
jgi:phosphoribosylaminoimidazole-succinocarboxamide synthase